MLLLIKWIFWTTAVDCFCRLINIGWKDYPREVTRGEDVFNLVFNGIFVVWAAHIIWG